MLLEVGVADLRDHLSRYIRLVQGGADVLITSRGRPVARLTGVGAPQASERLRAPAAISPPSEPRTPIEVNRLIKTKGSVSDFVIEQRR